MSAPQWLVPAARDERLARLLAAFDEHFGGRPAGVWAAPGRVNLIGEHVDYNAGLCLPIALPHTTLVAARADPGRLRLRSLQHPSTPYDGALADVGPGHPQGWAAYATGVPWALAQRGHAVGGLCAVVDGEVPEGAGLSSSAAIESAVALAVDALADLGLAASPAGRAQLASACVLAENQVAGASTGGLDQAAALSCRAGHALLLDCRDGSTRQVPFDPAGHALAVLVIDTQSPHRLVDGQYAARRATCAAAAQALGVPTLRELAGLALPDVLGRLSDEVQRRRTRHVLREIGRVELFVELVERGRVADVGPLLDASHDSLRADFEVSSLELDLAVTAARASGALGARMTGGGFGGSAIALVPRDGVRSLAQEVLAAFAAEGLTAPRFLLAEPCAGATRWL